MADDVAFVLGSAARREVLEEVAAGPAPSRTLVAECDASESAVYDALDRLADRGLVAETDAGAWQLTGAGRLVADTVTRCGALDRVLEADPEYWATHDPTGLPDRFRRSLPRLECCEVVRSPDTDPYRAARRVERAIRSADDVAIVAPVYSDRHAEALLDSDAQHRRLVMTPEMASQVVTEEPDGPEPELGDLEIRIQSAGVSLTVTDEELLFSLPTASGSFDAETEIASDGEAALDWGRRLFEYYWEQATPVAQWLASEHPEAVPDHPEVMEQGLPNSGGAAGRGESDDPTPPDGPDPEPTAEPTSAAAAHGSKVDKDPREQDPADPEDD